MSDFESFDSLNTLYHTIYIIYRNTGEFTIIVQIAFIRRGHWLSEITTKLNVSDSQANLALGFYTIEKQSQHDHSYFWVSSQIYAYIWTVTIP